MKIRVHLDVVEISGDELFEILAEAVRQRHGRELNAITWVNVVDRQRLGLDEDKLVHLNATLKPAEPK